MRRRRISIRGVAVGVTYQRQQEIKQQMRSRFEDAEKLDKFIDMLMHSGWTSLDIDSAVTQYDNQYRPAVQAFLFHNEHVLDQVRLTQATYTNFRDTAVDPNYALRHPAPTELILRRLTPGDLMMLSAAQYVSARLGGRDAPSDDIPDYWHRVWLALLDNIPEIATYPAAIRLAHNPIAAACGMLDYASRTVEQDTGMQLTYTDLQRTFMDKDNPFYVGITARFERTRVDDGFETCWCISSMDYRYESCWMAACVLLCYAVDNDARDILHGNDVLRNGKKFYKTLIRMVSEDQFSNCTEVPTNGNQEAENDTGPVSANRLLP